MCIGAARLAQLSLAPDDQILLGLDQRARNEFEAMVDVLYHLIELDRRQLHVGLSYASLFAYAVKHLRYSEGSAQRRISAARAIRDFPVVHEALLSRKLSLTAIAILSSSFTSEEKAAELVTKAEGKTQDQVRAIAVAEKPRASPTKDRIEPEAVLGPASPVESKPVSGSTAPIPALAVPQGSRTEPAPAASSPSVPDPVVMERFKFVFSAGPDFKQKFDRVRTLLSGKHPAGASFESVFEELLDEYIERHSPERRAARRAEQKAREGRTEQAPPEKTPSPSRAIPPALRDEIFIRDGGRCTFVAADGARCDSTWDLEIDHETPVARDGETTAANCRLRCRVHNVHAARLAFGDDVVDRAIEARRSRRCDARVTEERSDESPP